MRSLILVQGRTVASDERKVARWREEMNAGRLGRRRGGGVSVGRMDAAQGMEDERKVKVRDEQGSPVLCIRSSTTTHGPCRRHLLTSSCSARRLTVGSWRLEVGGCAEWERWRAVKEGREVEDRGTRRPIKGGHAIFKPRLPNIYLRLRNSLLTGRGCQTSRFVASA